MRSRLYLQAMTFGNSKWMVLLMKDLAHEQSRVSSGKPYPRESQKEIAEHERVEKLLFDDRQRLELVFRGVDLGLWDVDLQKDKLFANQKWAGILGYPPDEIEASVSFWHDRIHPDDHQGFFKAWNEHLAGSAERFEAEYRIRNKSGERRWLLTLGRVGERTGDGKPLRISGIVFDVTDRKCAEEKLLQMSKVFMDAIDPIFIRDLQGTVIDLNHSAEQTYGWCRNELIGKSIMTIVPTHLRCRQRNSMSAACVEKRLKMWRPPT